MDKVRRTVNRINDPEEVALRSEAAGFFREDPMLRIGFHEFSHDGGFGSLVGNFKLIAILSGAGDFTRSKAGGLGGGGDECVERRRGGRHWDDAQWLKRNRRRGHPQRHSAYSERS